jgi:hypothetical protein
VTTCVLLVWLVTLMWLVGQDGMACVYPDPPPGGCPDAEVRAGLRLELWLGPVLLAGPIAILAVQVWFSTHGHRYKPLWYLLAVILFCAAPGLLVDAASSSSAAVDRTDARLRRAPHHRSETRDRRRRDRRSGRASGHHRAPRQPDILLRLGDSLDHCRSRCGADDVSVPR